MHHIGKIDKAIYQNALKINLVTDDVIITENQIEHIISRRGKDFYDDYKDYFGLILSDPDYIFKDKNMNSVIVTKTIQKDDFSINLVVRLIIQGENEEYKNSIITAIKENQKRFAQRLRNNTPIYQKSIDKYK